MCLNGVNSERQCLREGVPQGSVLWPLLFSIYINDLPHCIDADGTTIHVSGNFVSDIETRLQSSLDSAKVWFNHHCTTINSDKSCAMLIGTRQKLKTTDNALQLSTGGAPLNSATKVKRPYRSLQLSVLVVN